MSDHGYNEGKDIDDILQDWTFSPSNVMTRLVRASDGRFVIQMRIDLGLMQMEVKHRPDGTTPFGFKTFLAYLKHLASKNKDRFSLTEELLTEAVRELKQYGNRRVCWLSLQRYSAVVRDADHSLALLCFLREHTPNTRLLQSLEIEHATLVLHRTQAATMIALNEFGPIKAIEEVSSGIKKFRKPVHSLVRNEKRHDPSYANKSEMIEQLLDLKLWIQNQYGLPPSLGERLENAVLNENYEQAAMLRDLIQRYQKQEIKQNDFQNTVLNRVENEQQNQNEMSGNETRKNAVQRTV